MLASALAVAAAGAAAITITPSSHDFGKVPVLGNGYHTFQVTLPTGAQPTDTMHVGIVGADGRHFKGVPGFLSPTSCYGSPSVWRTGSCEVTVEFMPLSVGVKSVTLLVTDSRGGRATSALRGEGVAFKCLMEVVSCNYAFLYSGTFTWSSTVASPVSKTTTSVTVNVRRGVATCDGSETIMDNGNSQTQSITGKGLIAVEFLRDSAKRLVYNITAACPLPAAVGTPSGPAELGHNDMQSYPTRATAVGMDLIGANIYAAPETDPVNNVTGNVNVSWSLKRW